MQNQKETYRLNRIRKNIIIGGAVILAVITVLSSVSSFMIYRGGFADLPYVLQSALSGFAVVVVEGAFVWLVYGYTRGFTSMAERVVCLVGMVLLTITMLINLVTHFQGVKGIPLSPFQHAWVSWGAIAVFIIVLIIVLLITLADPIVRNIRMELRYHGMVKEKELQAGMMALDSERVQEALETKAKMRAEELAERIINAGSTAQPQIRPVPGFASGPKSPQNRLYADSVDAEDPSKN